MKKNVLFLLIAFMASFSLFAQSGQKKEKKVAWHLEVKYPMNFGGDLRSNWNLGYLNMIEEEGVMKSVPLFPIFETWMGGDKLEDWNLQKAPYPQEYSYFLFNGVVLKDEFLSHFNEGDRKVYNGFSKTSYKSLIPQINMGIDVRLVKNLFFSLDLFGCMDQIKIQEEGYIFLTNKIVDASIYTEYKGTPYEHFVSNWQLDFLVEHPQVTTKINILAYGVSPMLKYEIPITEKLSITPKAGVMINKVKYQINSKWEMKTLYPADYLDILREDKDIFYPMESEVDRSGAKKDMFVTPIVGLEVGKKIYLTTEIQFNGGKNLYLGSQSDMPYKGVLLYENANKIKFPDIHPAILQSKGEEEGLKGNYGTPANNDFVHMDKIKLFKVGIGVRF